jgi:hypothetical protein
MWPFDELKVCTAFQDRNAEEVTHDGAERAADDDDRSYDPRDHGVHVRQRGVQRGLQENGQAGLSEVQAGERHLRGDRSGVGWRGTATGNAEDG